MITVFELESRWPAWSRWRPVTARPHDERFPFDPVTRRLQFASRKDAETAASAMRSTNAGETRIVETRV